MRYYEEVLAQAARNYAFTRDTKWKERYKMLEPESDKLLKNAIAKTDNKDKKFFVDMDKANLDLVELEVRALDLVDNDQAQEAINLLESEEYERRRKILRDGLTEQVKARELAYDNPDISQPNSIISDSTKTIIELERKLYEKLRETDMVKQEFLTMITHELKTPLVPIVSYVDILLSQNLGQLNEVQKEKLEIIRSSAQFLIKLISDLLDVQKIELGQLSLKKSKNNLSSIIKNALTKLQPDLESHGIVVDTAFQDDIFCLCDGNRIEQVLTNLISNAMDFCPKTSGKIIIKSQLEDNVHAKISIIDNGVGISKRKLDTVFVKFYQVDTSITREHGGTGLGLSICRGIVENHGGKIWAESEGANKGTQIHILLPLR